MLPLPTLADGTHAGHGQGARGRAAGAQSLLIPGEQSGSLLNKTD
jgi:hypothetical protein